MIKNRIISRTIERKLAKLSLAIDKSIKYINDIKSDNELRINMTIIYLVIENNIINHKLLAEKINELLKPENNFSDKEINKRLNEILTNYELKSKLL